jgi:hypothetical protein
MLQGKMSKIQFFDIIETLVHFLYIVLGKYLN